MECNSCNKEYDLSVFKSFRVYEDNSSIKRFDLCHNCYDKLINDDKLSELTDRFIEEGYGLYKISRCSNYDDCKKIDNLRKMCETAENLNQSSFFNPIPLTRTINWCSPADAGIIRSSVRLYELFDNYDKNSTELNNNMLNYTKNMHHLTWVLLSFAIVGFILTFINAYIAYLQLIK